MNYLKTRWKEIFSLPFFAIVSRLDLYLSWLERFFSLNKSSYMEFEWSDISRLLIAFLLWLVYLGYLSLKRKIENYITVHSYVNIEILKLIDNASPFGGHKMDLELANYRLNILKDEVKRRLEFKFKNLKSKDEIQNLIDSYFEKIDDYEHNPDN